MRNRSQLPSGSGQPQRPTELHPAHPRLVDRFLEVDNEGMNETQPHNLERERWRTLPTPPSNELIEMVGDGPSSADFDPAAPMAQQG